MSTGEHLERTRAAMAGAGVDVLMLGRQSNVRYVSGANQLALAGTRPFAPACVVVGATGAVHLLGVSDDGLPPGMPLDALYPMRWDPANIAGDVAALPGVSGARVVGVDGFSPLFEELLGSRLPRATFVDGEALLRAVRRVKTPDDVAGIRSAAGVTASALRAVEATLAPGATERTLAGAFLAAMGQAGVTTPAFDPVVHVAGGSPAEPTDRELRAGDLVHVRAGVVAAGWEAVVSRSLVCGLPSPSQVAALTQATAALERVTAAARPGTAIATLRAHEGVVAVDGEGLGHEVLMDQDQLESGMVVFVEVLLAGVLVGRMLLVTDGAPDVLLG